MKKTSMMRIFNESGKGYWMEGTGCLRAEGENRPSRPGHIVVGFDSYNLNLTGEIGRTLATSSGGLNEHIPVVVGCDLYNGVMTGDTACNMNANSNASANHAGPSVLILNDQGGEVMNMSEDVTSTLRAQDHGHPPVICFEPGIMSRDCSAGNRAYMNICSTLRAEMGDNRPAICYETGNE